MVLLVTGPASAAATSLGNVSIYNPAGLPRQDMWTRNIPCPQGVVFAGETAISVEDPGTGQREQTSWRPFCALQGSFARWPDGSVKIATVTFPVRLTQGETRTCAVNTGSGANPAFAMHAGVATGLAGIVLELEVEGVTCRLTNYSILEQTSRYQLRRYVGRPATGAARQFMFEVDLKVPSGMRHLRAWITVANSYCRTNPSIPTQNSDLPDIGFVPTQPIRLRVGPTNTWNVHLEFEAEWTLGRAVTVSGLHEIILADPGQQGFYTNRWPHGQGPVYSGVLVLQGGSPSQIEADTANAESTRMWPEGKSLSWAAAGLANPNYENVVPPIPPWFASTAEANAALNDFARAQNNTTVDHAPGQYDTRSHSGLNYRPGDTGAQAAFARITCWPEFTACDSSLRLRPMKRSAYHDTWRPNTCREHDTCAPIRAADHPQAGFFPDEPYFSPAIVPDSFGKNDMVDGANGAYRWSPTGSGGIYGADPQHYARGHVLATAQITGDWGLEKMLQEMTERWLLAFKYKVPPPPFGSYFENLDAARAVDRGFDVGCHLFHLNGRTDLLERINLRCETVWNQWDGATWREFVAIQHAEGSHYERQYHPQDPTEVPGWGEGMAVGGLMAAYALTGNAHARQIAKEISRMVCMYHTQDRTTTALQVLNVTNLYGQVGGTLAQVGDIYIERNEGGVEVARGIFVGETRQDGNVNACLFLRDCSALFPGRVGATLENLRDSACNRTNRSPRSEWQISSRMWWNGGQLLTAGQLLEWDPIGIGGLPGPVEPGRDPKFRNVDWGDFTAFLWWASAAYAYGKMFAQEDNDAAWLARCEAVIAYLKPKVGDRPSGVAFGWDTLPDQSLHQFLALPYIWSESVALPAYPENFAGQGVTPNHILFTWDPVPGAVSYIIKHDQWNSGQFTQEVIGVPGGMTSLFVVGGLLPTSGTVEHEFGILTRTATAQGEFSDLIPVETGTWVDVAPVNQGGYAVGTNAVHLQWLDDDHYRHVSQYRIQRKLHSNPSWTGAVEIVITNPRTQAIGSTDIGGLVDGTEYDFRLRGELDAYVTQWSESQMIATDA